MEIKVSSSRASKNDLMYGPIDQYGRYHIVSSIVKKLAKTKNQKKVKILDIGGYKGQTSDYFHESMYDVTILDLYDCKDRNYVKGSALDLPFADNSYDYVVSFEVLEHIPRQHRKRFMSEALRVSKESFILTAPFAGQANEVAQTEVLVNDVWKAIYGKDHLWLEEHIDNKIPTESEIEKMITRHDLKFQKIGNNDVRLWNLMVSFNFLTTIFRASGSNPQLQKFYNDHMHILDSGAEVYYRYIYVIGEGANIDFSDIKQKSGSTKKPTMAEVELTNKLFLTLIDDIQKLVKTKDKEIRSLSNKLEQRIQMYDELVEKVNLLSMELSHLNKSKLLRLKKRISRTKARK